MGYMEIETLARETLGVEIGASLPVETQLAHPSSRLLALEGRRPEPLKIMATEYGLKVEDEEFVIIYKLLDQANIYCVQYRAKSIAAGRKGMVNPFRGFVWFLGVLARPESGVKRIIGLSNGTVWGMNGLSTARLTHFLRRHLSGSLLGESPWGALLFLDLAHFQGCLRR